MILKQDEIFKLCDALIESGIGTAENRRTLLQFINPYYRASLRGGYTDDTQLLNDIGEMSRKERLPDGEVPLEIYLRNASYLLKSNSKYQSIILSYLSLVTQRVSGAPRIDITQFPETKEIIIFTDDTLPYIFLEKGLQAAKSVFKLKVPQFEKGAPRKLPNEDKQTMGNGTGWLLTKSLLITNWHVVNARSAYESDAQEQDLILQGKNLMAILDYNYGDDEGDKIIKALSLEAWDKKLDYAILRIEEMDREPLTYAAAKIDSQKEPVPVNIIQHPGKKSKRFGIRNNLVSSSTETDLNYFTDTEGGSSGSPVLNDKWEVVALHRAADYAGDVKFQGKSTAYVNVGTHLISILDHLRINFPQLAAETKA